MRVDRPSDRVSVTINFHKQRRRLLQQNAEYSGIVFCCIHTKNVDAHIFSLHTSQKLYGKLYRKYHFFSPVQAERT